MKFSPNNFLPGLGFLPLKILQNRSMCIQTSKSWCVKQVTRSNLDSVVEQLKEQIQNADFIAISLQSTGTHGAPWRRILSFDTSETAYSKAKDSAERFQLMHFAVCPFKWSEDSKVIAVPYNFHLFPRRDSRIGMPSYSFLCQLSSINYMVRKGFDFNSCVYDGISYVSRAKESSVEQRSGNPRILGTYPALSYQNKSNTDLILMENIRSADMIFMESIRSKVQHWENACLATSNTSRGGLVHSIKTAVSNNEMFNTRPCLRIDASSERQVQLILEVLREFSHHLVPLPSSVGFDSKKEVKVVLTSSEEDKHLLLSELQQQVECQRKQVSGIRDVVDAIINSGKPIVGYNCLTDFTIIYSNFIAPLPPTMKDFLNSLHGIFPCLLDVSHLLKVVHAKEVPRMKVAKNLRSAISYLNKRFFMPVNLEVPLEFKCYGDMGPESHGYAVLRLTYLFTKVCRLLKISSSDLMIDGRTGAFASYSNILYPSGICLKKLNYGGQVVKPQEDSSNSRTSNTVFVWGFKIGSSAGDVLEMLGNVHELCQRGIKVQLVDESCACIRFNRSRDAENFLKDVQSGTNISGFAKSKLLEEITSAGLRAVRYNEYEKLCKSSFCQSKLADSFNLVMSESDGYVAHKFTRDLPWSKSGAFILELGDL